MGLIPHFDHVYSSFLCLDLAAQLPVAGFVSGSTEPRLSMGYLEIFPA